MAAKPVVVGVDGSEESLYAVEWAALEARRHRTPLRIVSAAGMPPMRAYDASPRCCSARSAGTRPRTRRAR